MKSWSYLQLCWRRSFFYHERKSPLPRVDGLQSRLPIILPQAHTMPIFTTFFTQGVKSRATWREIILGDGGSLFEMKVLTDFPSVKSEIFSRTSFVCSVFPVAQSLPGTCWDLLWATGSAIHLERFREKNKISPTENEWIRFKPVDLEETVIFLRIY